MVATVEATPASLLPRVAIVGAGPAGLTLARILSQNSIPVTVFESDPFPQARPQGGTLDLHDDAGRAAIKAAALEDEYLKEARTDADGMRICDKQGRLWLRLPSSSENTMYARCLAQGKPEIDRGVLQKILRDSLSNDCVQYGKKVKAYDVERRCLEFTDGSSVDGFDLVVGADGGWSKVRTALSDVRPYHSGIGGFAFTVKNPEKTVPKICDWVNRGGWFNYGEERLLIAQHMGDGSLSCVAFGVVPENWQQQSSYDISDGVAVKEALLDIYKTWSPEAHELIANLDASSVWPRNLYMLPVDFSWSPMPGVTLIGDAVHLMLPFIGEGVNAAMRDALDLSKAIIDASTDREALMLNVQQYEESLFLRDHQIKRRCKDMAWYMLFASGAPGTTIDKWALRSMSDDLHPLLIVLLRSILAIVYFFYRLYLL